MHPNGARHRGVLGIHQLHEVLRRLALVAATGVASGFGDQDVIDHRASLRCFLPGGQYQLWGKCGIHTAPMAEIDLQNITKVFAGDVVAINDVSLHIEDGEFIALVGPSGCGKSTLLRAIAGLEEVTSGEISIGGRDVTDLAPRHRDIAMVFQSYALYPHMSVRQNLGYGLKVRRIPKAEIRRRVEEIAALLDLSELLERKPAHLSGGQRQRVAMGRAIVRQPQAFLMDEPLSNLDAKLRVGMRASLAQLHQQLGRHNRIRDARPGGGDDAGAACRGHAGRPHSAGGHAADALRAADGPVRRRVHWVAGDESRGGAHRGR